VEGVQDFYELEQLPKLVDLVRDRERGQLVRKVAGVAPLVFKLAQEGDAASEKILLQAGDKLARSGLAVSERLFSSPCSFGMIVGGGIFEREGYNPVLRRFRREINRSDRGIDLRKPLYPPHIGGLILAFERLGKERSLSRLLDGM